MGSVPVNPVVEPNTAEELPTKTNNKTRPIESLKRMWTDYYQPGEEGVTMPGSNFSFVIVGLLSFTAIKSQGSVRFPFQTHPQTIMVAITSMVMYGLASAAEHVISAACPGPNCVYPIIARLGRKLCLYILVGSLASLFYL